jgi:hypothetical protein
MTDPKLSRKLNCKKGRTVKPKSREKQKSSSKSNEKLKKAGYSNVLLPRQLGNEKTSKKSSSPSKDRSKERKSTSKK